MNHVKRRWRTPPGTRRKPPRAATNYFVISGEKIEISPLSDKGAPKAHLPKNKFPTLQELERAYIEKVLSHVGENKTRAAEILGIDRVSLWRKLKKHEDAAPAGSER